MEEVVVKRHNAAAAGYIVVIVIGLLVLIGGCVIGMQAEEPGALVIGIAIGVLILAMGVYYTVRFFMIPADVIVYRDGVLYLPGKVTCRPEELEKVFVKVYRSKYGAISHYGKMEITVRGSAKVYKYNNIAQVKAAQERLLQLNREALDKLVQPETAQPANDSGYGQNPYSN